MSDTQSDTDGVDATAILLDLLKQAAAAHGIHEAEVLGGVYDIEWPQWYATHMANRLAETGYRLVRVANPR
jgi:hypothetical protein